jgi:hypothetical protein
MASPLWGLMPTPRPQEWLPPFFLFWFSLSCESSSGLGKTHNGFQQFLNFLLLLKSHRNLTEHISSYSR